MEDQVQRLALAQLICLFRTQEAILDGLFLHPRHVDPSAVVADFDVHLSALVIGAQGKFSLQRFARPPAVLRQFNAVVAGVSHQVNQRILDGLNNGAVKFGFRSVHLQPDLFSERHRHIAHHARQLVPNRPNGLHARLHDALLQLTGDQVQTL